MALIHVYVGELRRIDTFVRRGLLWAGAGASLAYVLVYILPKLAEKQEILLASVEPGMLGFLEHHVYLMAMTGLVVHYAFTRVAAYGAERRSSHSWAPLRGALISTIIAYGAYNVLIGYLIVHRLRPEFFSLVLITLGMATHFVISDHNLRHHWPEIYERVIKWVLAIALLTGWALGVWTEISVEVISLWFAFLAGGMLIITIREELPSEEDGSFLAFLVGVVAYTALILLYEQMPKTVQ